MIGFNTFLRAVVQLVAFFVVAVVAEAEAQTEANQPPVKKWIDELDSDEFQTRQRASEALLHAGLPAVADLVRAAENNAPEAANRAMAVLERMLRAENDRAKRAARLAMDKLSQSKNERLASRAKAAFQIQTWDAFAGGGFDPGMFPPGGVPPGMMPPGGFARGAGPFAPPGMPPAPPPIDIPAGAFPPPVPAFVPPVPVPPPAEGPPPFIPPPPPGPPADAFRPVFAPAPIPVLAAVPPPPPVGPFDVATPFDPFAAGVDRETLKALRQATAEIRSITEGMRNVARRLEEVSKSGARAKE